MELTVYFYVVIVFCVYFCVLSSPSMFSDVHFEISSVLECISIQIIIWSVLCNFHSFQEAFCILTIPSVKNLRILPYCNVNIFFFVSEMSSVDKLPLKLNIGDSQSYQIDEVIFLAVCHLLGTPFLTPLGIPELAVLLRSFSVRY